MGNYYYNGALKYISNEKWPVKAGTAAEMPGPLRFCA
jgi:hypothetical protein